MSENILVWIETKDAAVRRASIETVGAAGTLAAAAGGQVEAVLIGEKSDEMVKQLSSAGVNKVYVVEGDDFAQFEGGRYADAMAQVVSQAQPKVTLMAATAFGKELSARLSGKLDVALGVDCTEISVADGNVVITRPIYAGKLLCDVVLEGENGPVATLRPNVFPVPESTDGSAEVVSVSADVSEAGKNTVVKETVYASSEMPDVSEADIVVSGGRGMKGAENFAMLEDLAKLLNGTVGASRSAVDAEWRDHQAQVGQTGKTISPNLYIACGISGATQHLAGMSSSKCIVAINKDADANIFKVADYGVVGDLFKVVPLVIEELKK